MHFEMARGERVGNETIMKSEEVAIPGGPPRPPAPLAPPRRWTPPGARQGSMLLRGNASQVRRTVSGSGLVLTSYLHQDVTAKGDEDELEHDEHGVDIYRLVEAVLGN